MSSLRDTPQQALAGWLLQRGGEKAIKKMADDLSIDIRFVEALVASAGEDVVSANVAGDIGLYTNGEVIFPSCPSWVVEKVKGLSHG